jgi:hypothetical protein
MSRGRGVPRIRVVGVKPTLVAGALLAASPFASAAELPVHAGMPAADAIEALGERTLFAPTCLDRTGAALLAPVTWRGESLWAAVLLEGNRVAGLRLHENRDPLENTIRATCESAFGRLRSRLAARGVAPGGAVEGRYDGPYFRWTQATADGGRLVAVWRASRATCQAWYEPPL